MDFHQSTADCHAALVTTRERKEFIKRCAKVAAITVDKRSFADCLNSLRVQSFALICQTSERSSTISQLRSSRRPFDRHHPVIRRIHLVHRNFHASNMRGIAGCFDLRNSATCILDHFDPKTLLCEVRTKPLQSPGSPKSAN